MTNDSVAIARLSYEAYVRKDRAALEALVAAEFHFTSPLDNRIDRATYFARCWPNSASIAGFEFIRLVPNGDDVFVTHECRTTNGARFCNRARCVSSHGFVQPTCSMPAGKLHGSDLTAVVGRYQAVFGGRRSA